MKNAGNIINSNHGTIGVSKDTVQRTVSHFANENSEINNTRGQKRPSHYKPRQLGGGGE